MQQIHKDLRAQQGQNDPLGKVAEQWAKSCRVLCVFDEFHVSDIADAMILGRLMEQLFSRGVILVTTSNYPPDGLYPNGLHRASFLPTIELLKAKLDVLNVDGGQDFRLRTLTAARTYLYPNNAENEQELTELFIKMATAHDESTQIEIEGRQLKARRRAGGAIWFDFAVLCGDGRGQADYLALAQEYHTVFFIWLAKTECRAKQSSAPLYLAGRRVLRQPRQTHHRAADVPVEEVYVAGLQASEFFRTASRLSEMQSKEYLALAHQTLEQQTAGVVET
ncbi:cell division protein ZapE [Deefgea sp. CFH1-16]|uniref:cell division protein ZapE n=1 Tax=Deefgea sp. CFH1-16 TaxID=2675457 RepID=UPI001FFC7A08|nr:cell division protein ZapE [Deefgea sp. CFH1-16]